MRSHKKVAAGDWVVPDAWKERMRGRLVLLRHSDQAIALVCSDHSPLLDVDSEGFSFGDAFWRDDDAITDVAYRTIGRHHGRHNMRHNPIIEQGLKGSTSSAPWDATDRYFMLIANLNPRIAEGDIVAFTSAPMRSSILVNVHDNAFESEYHTYHLSRGWT